MLDFLFSILYNSRVSCAGFFVLIFIAAMNPANRSDPVQLTRETSPFFIEDKKMGKPAQLDLFGNKSKQIPSHNEKYLIEKINEGKYRIDENGKIYCIYKKGEKEVKSLTSRGYIRVSFYHNKKNYQCRAHRIVWIYFNGDIPDKYEINHKNGIKTDNRLSNLELLTSEENWIHGIKHGLQKCGPGEKHYNARLTDNDIREIRMRFSNGESQIDIAKDFNMTISSIYGIVNRKTWKHI